MVVSESQHRRLGLGAAHEAGKLRASHFGYQTHQDEQGESKQIGDNEAEKQNSPPISAGESGLNGASGIRSGLGQEQQQTDFTQDLTRGVGQSRDEWTDAPHAAHNQSHNDDSGGIPDVEVSASGVGNGNLTDEES